MGIGVVGEYYVEQVVICNNCEADGKVTNHDLQSVQYRSRSYCPICRGSKIRRVSVTLKDALAVLADTTASTEEENDGTK